MTQSQSKYTKLFKEITSKRRPAGRNSESRKLTAGASTRREVDGETVTGRRKNPSRAQSDWLERPREDGDAYLRRQCNKEQVCWLVRGMSCR